MSYVTHTHTHKRKKPDTPHRSIRPTSFSSSSSSTSSSASVDDMEKFATAECCSSSFASSSLARRRFAVGLLLLLGGCGIHDTRTHTRSELRPRLRASRRKCPSKSERGESRRRLETSSCRASEKRSSRIWPAQSESLGIPITEFRV